MLSKLWEEFKAHITDDLCHALIYHLHIPEPTQDQIFDDGLYLINALIQKQAIQSLADYLDMPLYEANWRIMKQNQFIAD